MAKTNEELAAILLSGYLASGKISVTAQGAAKRLKKWTEAIEASKAEDHSQED
ncbi:hypothetical protein ACI1TR_01355 [Lactococcus garvieae]|uniref:hypothetical protein n=1 Tax=Lactococcus garvieae TaxID=1363 RepID=UPI003853D601